MSKTMTATKSNEQIIKESYDQIAELKQRYVAFLNSFIELQHSNNELDLQTLLELQQKGNQYFNYVEGLVGNTNILGAHNNGQWISGFAETCLEMLWSIILHFDLLRRYESFFNGVNINPSETAFANMQRLVVEYLPKDKYSKVKEAFEANRLPTHGFNVPAHEDIKETPSWKLVLSAVLGSILLGTGVYFAFTVPSLSPEQRHVIRALISIGVSLIGMLLTGHLNFTKKIRYKFGYFTMAAGGSLAIFALLWFSSPTTP